jgi:hypothetical protein
MIFDNFFKYIKKIVFLFLVNSFYMSEYYIPKDSMNKTIHILVNKNMNNKKSVIVDLLILYDKALYDSLSIITASDFFQKDPESKITMKDSVLKKNGSLIAKITWELMPGHSFDSRNITIIGKPVGAIIFASYDSDMPNCLILDLLEPIYTFYMEKESFFVVEDSINYLNKEDAFEKELKKKIVKNNIKKEFKAYPIKEKTLIKQGSESIYRTSNMSQNVYDSLFTMSSPDDYKKIHESIINTKKESNQPYSNKNRILSLNEESTLLQSHNFKKDLQKKDFSFEDNMRDNTELQDLFVYESSEKKNRNKLPDVMIVKSKNRSEKYYKENYKENLRSNMEKSGKNNNTNNKNKKNSDSMNDKNKDLYGKNNQKDQSSEKKEENKNTNNNSNNTNTENNSNDQNNKDKDNEKKKEDLKDKPSSPLNNEDEKKTNGKDKQNSKDDKEKQKQEEKDSQDKKDQESQEKKDDDAKKSSDKSDGNKGEVGGGGGLGGGFGDISVPSMGSLSLLGLLSDLESMASTVVDVVSDSGIVGDL